MIGSLRKTKNVGWPSKVSKFPNLMMLRFRSSIIDTASGLLVSVQALPAAHAKSFSIIVFEKPPATMKKSSSYSESSINALPMSARSQQVVLLTKHLLIQMTMVLRILKVMMIVRMMMTKTLGNGRLQTPLPVLLAALRHIMPPTLRLQDPDGCPLNPGLKLPSRLSS